MGSIGLPVRCYGPHTRCTVGDFILIYLVARFWRRFLGDLHALWLRRRARGYNASQLVSRVHTAGLICGHATGGSRCRLSRPRFHVNDILGAEYVLSRYGFEAQNGLDLGAVPDVVPGPAGSGDVDEDLGVFHEAGQRLSRPSW